MKTHRVGAENVIENQQLAKGYNQLLTRPN
jgi:hypothetical protein